MKEKKFVSYHDSINRITENLSGISESLFNSGTQKGIVQDVFSPDVHEKILDLFLEINISFVSRLNRIIADDIKRKTDKNFETRRMEKVTAYICSNFSKKINEASIAERFGYSTGHFSRAFIKINTCTFSVYLKKFRIKEAEKMLKETNLPVAEIAYCCGYSDCSYFIRNFKEMTGKTPTTFRSESLFYF